MKLIDLKKQLIGYSLSLFLTLAAFISVMRFNDGNSNISQIQTTFLIALLALAQLYVQLIFFLHLGTSRESRWNLVSFLYISASILLVVIGSIWIMNNLSYGHGDMDMKPKNTTNIIQDELPKNNHKHSPNDQQ
jgi:cytochrome o ubiquinol oxidase subunit IV